MCSAKVVPFQPYTTLPHFEKDNRKSFVIWPYLEDILHHLNFSLHCYVDMKWFLIVIWLFYSIRNSTWYQCQCYHNKWQIKTLKEDVNFYYLRLAMSSIVYNSYIIEHIHSKLQKVSMHWSRWINYKFLQDSLRMREKTRISFSENDKLVNAKHTRRAPVNAKILVIKSLRSARKTCLPNEMCTTVSVSLNPSLNKEKQNTTHVNNQFCSSTLKINLYQKKIIVLVGVVATKRRNALNWVDRMNEPRNVQFLCRRTVENVTAIGLTNAIFIISTAYFPCKKRFTNCVDQKCSRKFVADCDLRRIRRVLKWL